MSPDEFSALELPPPPWAALLHETRVHGPWSERLQQLTRRGSSFLFLLRSASPADLRLLRHALSALDLAPLEFVDARFGWRHARGHIESPWSLGRNAVVVFDAAAPELHRKALLRTYEQQRKQPESIWVAPISVHRTLRSDLRDAHPLDLAAAPSRWAFGLRAVTRNVLGYENLTLVGRDLLSLGELHTGSGSALRSGATAGELPEQRLLRAFHQLDTWPTEPKGRSRSQRRLDVIQNPRVQSVMADLCRDDAASKPALVSQALDMVRKLEAAPDSLTIAGMNLVFDPLCKRLFDAVEYDATDIDRVRQTLRRGNVILLPSHRSHMDYFFLSYIFRNEELRLPVIASGDNLDFFPAGSVLRHGGGFFIRRSFRGDRLYAAVLAVYLQELLQDGAPVELFLEGGRSRTGRVRPPKFGLLAMLVDAALETGTDTFFVPVSFHYDRIPETAAYERELRGASKNRETYRDLLKALEIVQRKFGRLHVSFGRATELRALRTELGLPDQRWTPPQRRSLITAVGRRAVADIEAACPVAAGGLVALVLLGATEPWLGFEAIRDRCQRLAEVAQRSGLRVPQSTMPDGHQVPPAEVRRALAVFLTAGQLERRAGEAPEGSRGHSSGGVAPRDTGFEFRVGLGQRLSLDITRNLVGHHFLPRGLAATAVARVLHESSAPTADEWEVESSVEELVQLLRVDLPHGIPNARPVHAALQSLIRERTLLQSNGGIAIGPGSAGWSGQTWLDHWVTHVRHIILGHAVWAECFEETGALGNHFGVAAPRATALARARGGVVAEEAIHRASFDGAVAALVDGGFAIRAEDGITIAERRPGAMQRWMPYLRVLEFPNLNARAEVS